MISVIIPSYKDPLLHKTIDSLLDNATSEIEIIAVLDGYWTDQIRPDKRVRIVHIGKNRGMRDAINAGVSVSKGNMNNFYVYCLRRPDKEDPIKPGVACPFYVGKGCGYRKNDHRKEAKMLLNKLGQKSIKIKIIHKLWDRGLDFKTEILFNNLTEKEAFDREVEVIITYGRIDLNTGCLSNLTDGGDGPSMSEETKQKISKSNTGKVRTNEVKKKMSETRKGKYIGEKNPRYGIKHTPEVIEKLRKANKGENNAMYGKKRPDLSAINKLRVGVNNPNFGKPMSDEQKKLIGEANSGTRNWMFGKFGEEHPRYGRKTTPETKEKLRKAKIGFIPWNKGLRKNDTLSNHSII